jgi:hypothetical protein
VNGRRGRGIAPRFPCLPRAQALDLPLQSFPRTWPGGSRLGSLDPDKARAWGRFRACAADSRTIGWTVPRRGSGGAARSRFPRLVGPASSFGRVADNEHRRPQSSSTSRTTKRRPAPCGIVSPAFQA